MAKRRRKTTPADDRRAALELHDGRIARKLILDADAERPWRPVWPAREDRRFHRWIRWHWTRQEVDDFDVCIVLTYDGSNTEESLKELWRDYVRKTMRSPEDAEERMRLLARRGIGIDGSGEDWRLSDTAPVESYETWVVPRGVTGARVGKERQ